MDSLGIVGVYKGWNNPLIDARRVHTYPNMLACLTDSPVRPAHSSCCAPPASRTCRPSQPTKTPRPPTAGRPPWWFVLYRGV